MKKDISKVSTYESGVVQSAAHRQTMRVKTTYLSQYGPTPMQWFAMGYAYEGGKAGVRLSDLKMIFDATMPFITNLVNQLESKGILQKTSDLDDSRIKIVKLNPSYLALVKEIEAGLRQRLREELYDQHNISRSELETYISVLYKIVKS